MASFEPVSQAIKTTFGSVITKIKDLADLAESNAKSYTDTQINNLNQSDWDQAYDDSIVSASTNGDGTLSLTDRVGGDLTIDLGELRDALLSTTQLSLGRNLKQDTTNTALPAVATLAAGTVVELHSTTSSSYTVSVEGSNTESIQYGNGSDSAITVDIDQRSLLFIFDGTDWQLFE